MRPTRKALPFVIAAAVGAAGGLYAAEETKAAVRLDWWLHQHKARLHKAGRRPAFRALYRLSLPLCRWVERTT